MHGGGIKVFYGSPYNKKIYISLLVRDQLFALLNLIQLSPSLVKLFNLKVRL